MVDKERNSIRKGGKCHLNNEKWEKKKEKSKEKEES